MRSMIDLMAIDIETQKIDDGCSLEKDFIQLIYIILLMIL